MNITIRLIFPIILICYVIGQAWLIPILPSTYETGANLQVAHLLQQGYAPYTQIFTQDNPLFVWILERIGKLEFSPVASRFVFMFFGFLLLTNTALIARLLLGIWAASASVFLLAFTTTFLVESSQVVAILPGLSIATLALVFALHYLNTQQSVWLFLNGVIWGTSLFISTSVLTAGLMVSVLLVLMHHTELRGTVDRRSLYTSTIGLWVVGLLFSLGLGVALFWPDGWLTLIFRQQVTLYQNLPISQSENFKQVGQVLALNFWVGVLAIYGLTRAYRQPRHPLWIVFIWGLLSFIWLMLQPSLRWPELLILTSPLAIIAGWGLVDLGQRLLALNHTGLKVGVGLCLLAITFWVSWQQVYQFNLRDVATADDLTQRQQWPEITAFIQQHAASNDCVIVDNAALAITTQRFPAPPLVWLTQERLESGLLTETQLELLTQEYECKMVVFSKRKYTLPLNDFEDWVKTHYPNKQEFIRTDIYFQ